MTPAAILGLIGRRLGLLLLASAVAVLIWIAFLQGFGITDLVGQRPWQVWAYLVTQPDAAAHRDAILANLAVTARDSLVGYVVGLTVAVVLALLFSLSATVERIFMPTSMVLRSVPLIILTPLITLIFGVNLGGVSVIVTLVVFLPSLANVLFGLRGANAQYRDLISAYGGGRLMALAKVGIPSAVPATLASARLSLPAAVTGAMIAEWLATGEGLGGSIARASGEFGYDDMWASAVAITAATMLAYTAIGIIDTIVVARFTERQRS
jgi:ABC-type nitrate/sulfonate/bicarbonate transport system permease component